MRELFSGKKRVHGRVVGKICGRKSKALLLLQKGKAVFFQLYVVVIIQAVKAYNSMPFGKKTSGKVKPYESGCAGD
jgi:hypothetical protein